MQIETEIKQNTKLLSSRRENALMYLEDLGSGSMRAVDAVFEGYKAGQQAMLRDFAKDFRRVLGVEIPSTSYHETFECIHSALSNQNNTKRIYLVKCGLEELYQLSEASQKVISLVEQGLTLEGKLKIGQFKLLVKVCKNEYIETDKGNILNIFEQSLLDSTTYDYKSSLHHEGEEMSIDVSSAFYTDLENSMHSFWTMEKFEPIPVGLQSMSIQDLLSYKFKKQQKKIIKEKEWANLEGQKAKEKYRQKKQKLHKKLHEQKELEQRLKQRVLDAEKEKSMFEKSKEANIRSSLTFRSLLDQHIKMLSETISDIQLGFEVFDNMGKAIEAELISEVTYRSDSDTSFDNSMIQVTAAICPKPLVSNLQPRRDSRKASSKDMSASKPSLHPLSTKHHSSTPKGSQKCSPKSFTESTQSSKHLLPPASPTVNKLPLTPHIRTSKPSKTMPKEASQRFLFNDTVSGEIDNEENQLKNLLAEQQRNLSEKEEMIEKEKNEWMQKWRKIPYADELIPMVQNEMLKLRKLKEEFEKKKADIYNKELEVFGKVYDAKKKGKEADIKMKEAVEFKEKLEEEKGFVILRLAKLRDEIEG